MKDVVREVVVGFVDEDRGGVDNSGPGRAAL